MAIIYMPEKKLFTIHTAGSTWQMKVGRYGHLLHVYYGKKVEDTDLSYLIREMDRGFSGVPYEARIDRGYSLDTLPQEYPSFGAGDYRIACLHAVHEDGSQAAEFRYVSHRIYDGKYRLPGLPALHASSAEAQTLEILLRDKSSGLEVLLYYGVLERADVITRACRIRNAGKTPVRLLRALSCCIDLPDGNLDLITFYGRHAMERNVQRNFIPHGRLSSGSTRGTSSHQANPFVILSSPDAGEEQGVCYGITFVYSGNFLAETEVDQTDQTRLVMGIHPEGFCWTLEGGEEFVTPEVLLAFSADGFGSLSRKLHDLYREHLIPRHFLENRRPILLNNWEVTEFDFTEKELLSLAESAAGLGIELFVMDDGWFGSRNHDGSGLGDWTVNRQKLPSGLNGFSEKLRGMGLQFGIWIEPEMVNEDSDLYRAHPDWCLQIPGRTPNLERCQLVLDLSRKEVRDCLFESISKVVDEAQVSYVKWDMNRNLSDVWSAALPAFRQGEVAHRYVLGLYELMERLTGKYPEVLWEGCSGGGGRFDAGILCYMPQIWCSDNTDAIERIRIQYGTSFGYPVCTMGAHVSASPNRQTGRKVPLETRAEVAMAGTFGYEMDVRMLDETEQEQVRQQIRDYMRYERIIRQGDYYRLTSPWENAELAVWQFVTKDRRESLVSMVALHSKANPPFRRIRVKGLIEDAEYRIEGDDRVYRGSALMHAGLPVPVLWDDYQSCRFYLRKVG